MKITEFRKLIREEVRRVLKEATVNDISDDILKSGWGYTFNVGDNINTIIAYNSSGQRNLMASNSLNLNSVKNLTDKIGPEAVKMILANFATKAKKITKADLSNSNLITVTDHNVSDPIFITQEVNDKDLLAMLQDYISADYTADQGYGDGVVEEAEEDKKRIEAEVTKLKGKQYFEDLDYFASQNTYNNEYAGEEESAEIQSQLEEYAKKLGFTVAQLT